ncbi:MAG: TetR/AcrR family transcriptional regulator [Gammaproteobacteria bacterium]|nr:TetR/AcrR family transcriptional regulator [Gammaproteobacteria bacterium]
MPVKGEQNRVKILQAAADLFYQRGYNNTSFSDVAMASGVPKGNFYYYFKSKDELLGAVIGMRKSWLSQLISEWEAEHTEPKDRLRLIVRLMQDNSVASSRYGCPVGSLNVELVKNDEEKRQLSRSLFDLLLSWSEKQFLAMGKGSMAKLLAIHLMAMAQGGIMISSIYQDEQIILAESERINLWIDALD